MKTNRLQVTGLLQGSPGKDGKSAYEYAVDGGYKGTEEEFSKRIAEDHATDYMPVFENESVGENIKLNDSAEKPFKRLTILGKTDQITTTGAQLIERPYTDGESKTVNGIQFTVEADGGIKVAGTATGTTYFYLSNQDFGSESMFNHTKPAVANGKTLSGAKDSVKTEYNANGKKLYIVCDSGKTFNTVIYPQLQNGDKATPYEIYTGGKPSPSPEYPQKLVSAGKLNEGTGKYEVDVKLTGKNLFDIEKAKDIHNWIDIQHIAKGYVAFPIYIGKIGANITASYSERLNTGLELYLNLSPDLVTCKWLYHGVQASNIKQSATITANDKYVYIRCNVNHVDTFIENIKTMQIEISDTPTPYEPYKGQYLTLTSDRPITKWDKLEKRDGIYGWVRKSEIKIIDGTEILFISDVNSYIGQKTTNVYFNFYDMISGIPTVENGFCNKIPFLSSSWGKLNDGKIGFCYNKNQIHMRLDNNDTGVQKDDTADVAIQKIKTYLKNEFDKDDPFIFLYETKTETFVPLSDSEQQSLNVLHTYYPTTIISNDAGAHMEVSYIADTKNYIDTKIAEMRTALANTNAQLLNR